MSDLFFLGLDGGGTKTKATLIDGDAQEIARATSGPSNYHSLGQATMQASLQAAMQQALEQAAVTWDDVTAIGLGLAGVARPRDFQVVRALLTEIAPTTCLEITHDAETALVGGIGCRHGVALIAGTGAIVYGVNARGQTRRADGWGYLLGDEGSGYWIGREALRATARACDGRDPPTALQSIIMTELDIEACDELVHRVYETSLDVPQIAALAPTVLIAARQGDAVALDILQRASALLGSTLCAVILGLDMAQETFDVVLLGGVLSASALIRERVAAAVKACAPHATVIQPKNDAAFGAALLARELWTKGGKQR
jgi:N-acetylglucosamine kinase